MGVFRAIATAILVVTAASALADECVSTSQFLSSDESDPALVAGPSAWTGLALAVASTEPADEGIWITVFDEGMNTLAGSREIVPASDSGAIDLIWNGTELGLFYRVGSTLRLQRLNAFGDPIGTPVAIPSSRLFRAGEAIAIAWSAARNAWVIARVASQSSNNAVFVLTINPDGSTRREVQISSFTTKDPDLRLAVTDTGVVGVFFEFISGGLSFARLVADETSPAVVDVGTTARDLVVTSIDNLFVLAWTELAPFDQTEIHWKVIDSSGQTVRPAELLVDGIGQDVRPLGLTAGDDEIALAYLDSEQGFATASGNYHLRRFRLDGTVLADTVGDPRQSRAFSIFPLVYTGTSYFSAPVRQFGSGERRSFLLRVCPLRAEIVTAKRLALLDEPLTFTAVASGGVPPYSYLWTFGDRTATAVGAGVEHRYERVGTYVLTLRVTDSAGAVVTTSDTIEIVRKKQRAVRK
jgi:hypothetical protein